MNMLIQIGFTTIRGDDGDAHQTSNNPGVVATEKHDVSSALAFGVPALTTNARNTASRLLDNALGTVAKTHNFNGLNANPAERRTKVSKETCEAKKQRGSISRGPCDLFVLIAGLHAGT
jgi:hypothetical protein